MEWYALLGLGIIALTWNRSMAARELALDIARQACQDLGVTLLDETVAVTHWRIRRSTEGRLTMKRVFTFQFVDHTASRYDGTITLMGNTLEHIALSWNPQRHEA